MSYTRHIPVGLILLNLLSTGGCIDLTYSITREAACPGVTLAAAQAALASDDSVEVAKDDGTLHCRHAGVYVDVWVSGNAPTVRVSVGEASRPDAETSAAWREAADHICGRLDAAFPGLGPWEEDDNTDPSPGGAIAFFAVVVGLGVLGVWLLARFTIRAANRPFRARSNPEPTPAQSGWRAVAGRATPDEVAEIDRVVDEDLGTVDPNEWR